MNASGYNEPDAGKSTAARRGMPAYAHHLVCNSFKRVDKRLEREDYHRYIRHIHENHTDHSGCDRCCSRHTILFKKNSDQNVKYIERLYYQK